MLGIMNNIVENIQENKEIDTADVEKIVDFL